LIISATAIKAVYGGQSNFSTPEIPCKPGIKSATNPFASATVLFNFQFPATNGVRIFTSYLFDFC
jgi:hypothetical protein